MATRNEIKTIISNYITTNGIKSITALQVKELFLLIADYYRHQDDTSFLGFTPEDSVNKSTNTTLGTSNTLFPTQNAVKVYADTKNPLLTASNFHSFVNSLSSMATVNDADFTNITDNSASLQKKVTWANIKSNLKTYFDAIYTTTSAVATQITTAISGKSDKLITENAQTGTSYTLVLSDADKLLSMNNASANTVTIPPNSSVAFSIGTQIVGVQLGAGQTSLVAGAGVTIRSSGSKLKVTGQYSGYTLIKQASDTWLLMGDISA